MSANTTRIEELAWAGGVLEAKGYANHKRDSRRGKGYRYRLRLTDTRPELLQRFADIVGVGKVNPVGITGSAVLPTWRWELWSRVEIEDVLGLLDDYLFDETKLRLSPSLALV